MVIVGVIILIKRLGSVMVVWGYYIREGTVFLILVVYSLIDVRDLSVD